MTLEGYLKLLDAVDRARPPLRLDVHPTTREVARAANLSRQMAAHYLRELEREGFVRGRGWDHVAWRLTPRGAALVGNKSIDVAHDASRRDPDDASARARGDRSR